MNVNDNGFNSTKKEDKLKTLLTRLEEFNTSVENPNEHIKLYCDSLKKKIENQAQNFIMEIETSKLQLIDQIEEYETKCLLNIENNERLKRQIEAIELLNKQFDEQSKYCCTEKNSDYERYLKKLETHLNSCVLEYKSAIFLDSNLKFEPSPLNRVTIGQLIDQHFKYKYTSNFENYAKNGMNLLNIVQEIQLPVGSLPYKKKNDKESTVLSQLSGEKLLVYYGNKCDIQIISLIGDKKIEYSSSKRIVEVCCNYETIYMITQNDFSNFLLEKYDTEFSLIKTIALHYEPHKIFASELRVYVVHLMFINIEEKMPYVFTYDPEYLNDYFSFGCDFNDCGSYTIGDYFACPELFAYNNKLYIFLSNEHRIDVVEETTLNYLYKIDVPRYKFPHNYNFQQFQVDVFDRVLLSDKKHLFILAKDENNCDLFKKIYSLHHFSNNRVKTFCVTNSGILVIMDKNFKLTMYGI